MNIKNKKKLKIRKIYSSIIIISILAILSFFILKNNVLQNNITNTTWCVRTETNKIFGNLTEYNNPLYMSTLTETHRNDFLMNLDQMFNVKCDLNNKCSVSFLSVFIDMKTNLGIPKDDILKNREHATASTYLKIPHKLTENELKGFEIPLLINLCKVGFLNQTEKVIWGERIIDIEKSDLSLSSYKQILYFIDCLNMNTINDLNKSDVDKIKNKLCSNAQQDIINIFNPCEVFVNLRVKHFCGIEVTSDEKIITDTILSEKYYSYSSRYCQDKLSNNYNQFFQ